MNYILQGDVIDRLKDIPDQSVNCIVTSPPYYALRDYGVDGQIGLEQTPDEYITKMVEVFSECRRVLRDDGTLWINISDSYNGSGGNHTENHKNDSGFQGKVGPRCGGKPKRIDSMKSKDLIGIPWMLAFALRSDGWYLRQDIIWHKPNPMPESVRDRCTKAHEYIFLLSKSHKYYFDSSAVKEQAVGSVEKRNRRSVWSVSIKPFKEAHFATFPPDLIEPCILAGCPKGGTVLDPFMGSGTTALVSEKHQRNWIGIELNPEYIEIANNRIQQQRNKGFQLSAL